MVKEKRFFLHTWQFKTLEKDFITKETKPRKQLLQTLCKYIFYNPHTEECQIHLKDQMWKTWLEKQDSIDKDSIRAVYDKYSSVESIKKKLFKDFKIVYECPGTKEGISIKEKEDEDEDEDEEKRFSERSVYGELCRHILKGKSLSQVAKYVA